MSGKRNRHNKKYMGSQIYRLGRVHKYAIFFFSLFMLYHIYAHWKWYKAVIIRHLIGKNIQVTILSILFLLVALTGLIPWFIDLSGSTSLLRMLFIELHDKFALVLIIFIILHLVKKLNGICQHIKN